MHIEEEAVERTIGQLIGRDLGRLGIQGALGEVATALPALFGVDGAGIMLLDDDQVLRYVASTDREARLLEAVQESTGRGPCVEALVDNVVVACEDLLEDGRWPDLAGILVPNGVRAVLGSPLRVAGAPIGSLNVFTREAHRWDESECRALAALERVAEGLIVGALASQRNERVVAQLQQALETRVEIERAVGILMALEEISATSAFERIRRSARASRRSVHEIAKEVVTYRKLR